MRWLDRWRARSRARLERSERVEAYLSELSHLRPEIESCLFSRSGSLKSALLDSVVEHCLRREIHCDYCGAVTKYWGANPRIFLTLYPVTLFKDPPPDGRDLKLVYLKGWVGTFQASGCETVCGRCGKRHHFYPLQWLQAQRFLDLGEDFVKLPKRFPGHAGPL